MRKVFPLVLSILVAATLCAAPVRVGVVPYDLSGGEVQARAVKETFLRALVCNLAILEETEPVVVEVDDAERDVREVGREYRLERLLRLSFSEGADGYRLSILVYDTKGGTAIGGPSVRISRGAALFEALVAPMGQVLTILLGREVSLGRLVVQNLGEPGRFQLEVDGVDLGDRLKVLAPLVTGTHSWTVRQRRFGRIVEIQSGTVDVAASDTGKIIVSIPRLLPEEERRIQGLEDRIKGAALEGRRDRLEALLAEWEALFGDVSFAPSMAGYRERVKAFRSLVQVGDLRREVEGRVLDPDPFFFQRIRALEGALPEEVRSDPAVEDALAVCAEEALLSQVYHVFRLFRESRFGEAMARYSSLRPLLVFVRDPWRIWYERLWFHMSRMDERYLREGVRGRDLVLPILETALGVSLDIVAVYLFYTDDSAQLLAEAYERYPDYLAADTPEEAARLHREIEDRIRKANNHTFAEWGCAFGGLFLSIVGPIHLYRAVRAPAVRAWEELSLLFPRETAASEVLFTLPAYRIDEWIREQHEDMVSRLGS
ncbi:hypothetical protein Spith_0067 [Spirochaeta thermophila DSM 6578]|uniref:PEGA domain-containing protein n=1 Tax=Winmispira thermophila (strain ATCC 700085 / DSM 6578 / Z-1203) TaxID=869211 RepID=G0GBJ5_WINT7|nr:hypothetical protein [Spirochaeta thermophila]AEJ60354.1 hypothetical protein Spith_0067 [Spirochaeta thermophila DSM 6578]